MNHLCAVSHRLIRFPAVLILAACLWGAIPTRATAAGPFEMTLSRGVLQSFVDSALPVTVTRDIPVLGVLQIPVTITLANPGPLSLEKATDVLPPALDTSMDYALSSPSPLVPAAKGRLAGKVGLFLSPDGESLLLTFDRLYIDVTPEMRLSLGTLIRPVALPLMKGIPVRIDGQEVLGRFSKVIIGVEGDLLKMRGEASFAKASELKGE